MDRVLTNLKMVTMMPDTGYQIIDNAMIGIEQGKIAFAGHADHYDCHGHPEVIDCHGALVTPGLIDCHTHLVFAGNRANEFEQRLNGVPYETIAKAGGGILATVNATRNASEEELYELACERLQGLKNDGVTSVEIKSGYGLTLDSELKMLRVARRIGQQADIKVSTTLLAAHALPPEFKDNADGYIDLICQEIIPVAAKEQLADAVDVFCEGIGFSTAQCQRVFEAAKQHGLAIKGHTEQLSNLGGSAMAARMGALSVDHIEYLDEQGVEALAQHGTVATLLPGAFYFLRETQQPPIEALRRHQVPMAISTDFNPGTSPLASLRAMMNMACTLFRLTPEETLRGVTQHAAQALGVSDSRGQIKVGMDADLAVWSVSHPAELSYRIGVPDLKFRVVDGHLFFQPAVTGAHHGR
ncbi:imidazolonepropionase [Photobacterium ganghwense]|uniref:Imidazolonepropionase n=1 Tax=Photobacterium ganghwense TaxID=320778 RepID=A0A0J1HCJ3_9GAMM|nr:imidazolonepropionase [Photobacterium ganghwense]KLV09375.1 imidazolonepropionase [Photobacterium ganghwense]PSU08523.1 imidazolonepropionase [Photobacterium ganghwense]